MAYQEKWGREKARERYGSEGMKKMARGGSLDTKKGSGAFPGQSEKEFEDSEARNKRNSIHGAGADFDMTDTDTVSIDRANSMADPEKKDRGGY